MCRILPYSVVHLIAEIRLISVNTEIPRILAILDILAIPAFYEMMACAYATPVLPLQDWCSRVIVVGVASVAFLNHVQRMLIAGNRILQAAGHIAGLRIAGQCRSVMRTMFQMPGT